MADSDPVAKFEKGLKRVQKSYARDLGAASDEPALRQANAQLVGPQGELTQLMKLMPKLPGDRRRELGQRANALKQEVQQAFDTALSSIHGKARQAELSAPPLDVTLPGRWSMPGRLHPITRVRLELEEIFASLGFDIADGPEIDLHENCFDKLGFPPDHPATDEHVQVRFRASYFPFVEPGGEVDISCVFCRSWENDEARTAACRVCKGSGWLEILGCGMIHPVVFENVGYDPDRYTGFAFGLGLDRVAMLKYGIPNIKLLYENDIRFLEQF